MFALLLLAADLAATDPQVLMERVAANVASSVSERSRYVYEQKVRSTFSSGGQVKRRESRRYQVIPFPEHTKKELLEFRGEYRRGKQMIAYDKPGYQYKSIDIDGALISGITDDLVNAKDSRDGIPKSLFPLTRDRLVYYRFAIKRQTQLAGRDVLEVAFEPSGVKCQDEDGDGCLSLWAGTAWIDTEEFQPVRIATRIAYKIPWGVRFFLGTNVEQLGFSISYVRVGANVWFPSTYGTEFRMNGLWAYRRTMALSLENSGFRRADADSTIRYLPIE